MKRYAALATLFAVFAYAWAAVLIRWAGEASPFAIAFYRMLVASIVWTPAYWMGRVGHGKRNTVSRREIGLMILAGGFLCFHFATWISSLSYTTVASAVFLMLAQPIMVAIAAHFFLGERLNRVNILAFFTTIAGALLIFGGDLQLGPGFLRGDLLALIGAAGSGAYLFIARIVRPSRPGRSEGIPLYRYLPWVYWSATIGLLILCIVTGERLGPFTTQTWLALLALGLVPTVIGHSLFNWSLGYLPAFQVNIALVGEPIGASLLAFLLLAEMPSSGLFWGASLMILSVVLVYLKPPKGD